MRTQPAVRRDSPAGESRNKEKEAAGEYRRSSRRMDIERCVDDAIHKGHGRQCIRLKHGNAESCDGRGKSKPGKRAGPGKQHGGHSRREDRCHRWVGLCSQGAGSKRDGDGADNIGGPRIEHDCWRQDDKADLHAERPQENPA
jgi:hypothetical protein